MATDKTGFEIKAGDSVVVGEPSGSDMWNHEFAGQVEEIYDDGTIRVVDGDGDCWDMDANQVEVQED